MKEKLKEERKKAMDADMKIMEEMLKKTTETMKSKEDSAIA